VTVTTAATEYDVATHERVRELTAAHSALWWRAGDAFPDLRRTFTVGEQRANERELDRFIEQVVAEADNAPQTEKDVAATQQRIMEAFGGFAKGALGLEDRHLDVILGSGFTASASMFAREARRFDSRISGADIFQASRNAWTMNGLQRLLGLPVRLTPSIFAYSMLYPYTDNFLDDPTVSPEEKAAFNRRFSQQLQGETVDAEGPLEERIHALVDMIEEEHPRSDNREVYNSLLAIQGAQIRSVDLMAQGASPYEVDVLEISLEKGGTSVLADGYLIAGRLTPAQSEFMFGWGAFLQLVDDLQDAAQDRQDGLMTVYSQTAGHWDLAPLANRAFGFGADVMERLEVFEREDAEALKELMWASALGLLVDGVGRARRYVNAPAVRRFERHSAFRFGALRKRRIKLRRRNAPLMALIEAFSTSG